jgi:hypothetical protein
MRKEPGGVYDKWNISVIICDKELKFDITPSDLRYSVPNIHGREVLF